MGSKFEFTPHLHCIVPGGGVNAKGNWQNLRADGKFLFAVKALSKVFRAKYIAELSKNWRLTKRPEKPC
jgi:predicted transposase YbfD/YdcC